MSVMIDGKEYQYIKTYYQRNKIEAKILLKDFTSEQMIFGKVYLKSALDEYPRMKKYLQQLTKQKMPFSPYSLRVFDLVNNQQQGTYEIYYQTHSTYTLDRMKKEEKFGEHTSEKILKIMISVMIGLFRSQQHLSKFTYSLEQSKIYFMNDQKTNIQEKILLSEPVPPECFFKKLKDVANPKGFACFLKQPIECWKSLDFDLEKYQIWKLGILLFTLLHNYHPFAIISEYETLFSITNNFNYFKLLRKKESFRNLKTLTSEYQLFFQRVFQPNPEKRIDLNHLRKQPLFFNRFPSLEQDSPLNPLSPDESQQSMDLVEKIKVPCFLFEVCQKFEQQQFIFCLTFRYLNKLYGQTLFYRLLNSSQICSLIQYPNELTQGISQKKTLLTNYSRQYLIKLQDKLSRYKQECEKEIDLIQINLPTFKFFTYEQLLDDENFNQFISLYEHCSKRLYQEFRSKNKVNQMIYLILCYLFEKVVGEDLKKLLDECFMKDIQNPHVQALSLWLSNASQDQKKRVVKYIQKNYF